MKDVYIPMFGSHNVSNALAGIAVAVELGIDENIIKQAFSDFSGVKRRFSVLGTVAGVTFVDDYAHHPSEIKAVIAAARQTSATRIVVIFQPHRYTRFADLWREFVQALSLADVIIAMPVYTAGEQEIPGVNSLAFVEALARQQNIDGGKCEGHYAANVNDAEELLKGLMKSGDCVIGMGAGSISEHIHKLYCQVCLSADLSHVVNSGKRGDSAIANEFAGSAKI